MPGRAAGGRWRAVLVGGGRKADGRAVSGRAADGRTDLPSSVRCFPQASTISDSKHTRGICLRAPGTCEGFGRISKSACMTCIQLAFIEPCSEHACNMLGHRARAVAFRSYSRHDKFQACSMPSIRFFSSQSHFFQMQGMCLAYATQMSNLP